MEINPVVYDILNSSKPMNRNLENLLLIISVKNPQYSNNHANNKIARKKINIAV